MATPTKQTPEVSSETTDRPKDEKTNDSHADHSSHQDHSGHSNHDHHKKMVADFKFRFWWVLALTIPIMALSPMIQHFLGGRLAFRWGYMDSCHIVNSSILLWGMAVS